MRRVILLVATSLLVAGCRRIGGAPSGPPPTQSRRVDAAPRRLPTFLDIDWAAFPHPVAEPRGRSGRSVTLRPGKAVIARALEQAAPGDTLLLEPGTYTEGLDGDHRALVLDKEGLVLRAVGGRARVVPGQGIKRGLMVEASQITVQGIDLDGFSDAGISLGKEGESLRQIVLSDLTVTVGAGADGIAAYPDHRQSGKPVIDGLLLRNIKVSGGALGISCNGGPCRSWWLENVDVSNAEGSGSGADAIGIESGDNFVLINVTVSGASADGIDLKATRALLVNPLVRGVQRNGVKLWMGGDIINAVIDGSGADAAVAFNGPGRYRLLHGLIAHHNYGGEKSYCLTSGHDVKSALQIELRNTIFYRTSGGLFLSSGTTPRIEGCLFYDQQNPIGVRRVLPDGSTEELPRDTLAAAIERAGLGGGNISGKDPRFADPERGDFRPLPAGGCGGPSPILDAGRLAQPMPETDFAGQARVKGAAPDIGPLEQQ
jgi:hypothetical protein